MTDRHTPWAERPVWAKCCLLAITTLGVWLMQVAASLGNTDTAVFLLGANALVTSDWVLPETLARLVNNWVYASRACCNRSYDSRYKVAGAKVGSKVTARLPQRYKTYEGAAITQWEDIDDQTVEIEITHQKHIPFRFGMWALTFETRDYAENYVQPAVEALTNVVDHDGLQETYRDIYHTVGTPGTVPGSTGTLPQAATRTYLDAVVKLREAAAPKPYIAMLSPDMHSYLMNGAIELFNPAGQISQQFREGEFNRGALGIQRWFLDQNVHTHVVGALGGTPLVNGASQTGSTLAIDGAGGAVTDYFLQGDTIQVASVNSINPLNYTSTGRLQDFVVTADTDADSNGDLSVPISPAITIAGHRQTVNAAPADGAAITTFGHASNHAGASTPTGLVYNKMGNVLVMADLERPMGQWVSERISNADFGISMRLVKWYEGMTDQSPCRLDVVYGWKQVRPETACRVQS